MLVHALGLLYSVCVRKCKFMQETFQFLREKGAYSFSRYSIKRDKRCLGAEAIWCFQEQDGRRAGILKVVLKSFLMAGNNTFSRFALSISAAGGRAALGNYGHTKPLQAFCRGFV